jgi:hypothetical protein
MTNKKILYHATGSDYEQFDLAYTSSQMGIHLGSKEQAANVINSILNNNEDEDNDKDIFLLTVECEFKNAIRLEDFGGWQGFQLVLKINEMLDIKLSTSASDRQIRSKLIELGYDSVVYSNDFEGEGDSYISLIPNKQTKILKKEKIPKVDDIEEYLLYKTKGTNNNPTKLNYG